MSLSETSWRQNPWDDDDFNQDCINYLLYITELMKLIHLPTFIIKIDVI